MAWLAIALLTFSMAGCSIPSGRWENMPYLSPSEIRDAIGYAVGKSPADGKALLAKHRFDCELLDPVEASTNQPALTCLRPPYEFTVYTTGEPKPGYKVTYEIREGRLGSYRLNESWAKK